MEDYHIGTLDQAGKDALLTDASASTDCPTLSTDPTFLNPRSWKKAVLHSKTSVSADTRLFTFRLEHDTQTLGLPVGKHLMLRLRDPVTREAIIRAYTPISHTTKQGFVDVLVKVYFDSAERRGGKMSQAMDSLPIGHFMEFKGPVGKFEYLGRGRCALNGVERFVKRFVMICGGSGITPIYQVLRAVMEDDEDETKCVTLDGNRLVGDILCKEDLDGFVSRSKEKCEVLYTLTKGGDDWEGLRGRIDASLLKKHAGRGGSEDGEAMALICGPEALEKSAHQALLELGWNDDELLFF